MWGEEPLFIFGELVPVPYLAKPKKHIKLRKPNIKHQKTERQIQKSKTRNALTQKNIHHQEKINTLSTLRNTQSFQNKCKPAASGYRNFRTLTRKLSNSENNESQYQNRIMKNKNACCPPARCPR